MGVISETSDKENARKKNAPTNNEQFSRLLTNLGFLGNQEMIKKPSVNKNSADASFNSSCEYLFPGNIKPIIKTIRVMIKNTSSATKYVNFDAFNHFF